MSGGWIPDNYDPKDKPYRCASGTTIHKSIDLRKAYPDAPWGVYDQFKTSSCVANATAAAYRFLAWRLYSYSKQYKKGGSAVLTTPSRRFIYWNARLLPEVKGNEWPAANFVPEDNGCHNRNALKSLNRFGVCSERLMPFNPTKESMDANPKESGTWDVVDINKSPGDPRNSKTDTYKEASNHKVVEYCRLDPDMPNDVENQLSMDEKKAVGVVTLALLKQCLSEGYPVVFGYQVDGPEDNVFRNWNTRKGIISIPDRAKWNVPTVKYLDRQTKTEETFRHTVMAIGYDDEKDVGGKKKEGMVLCQNSWGAQWGDKGFFWISYNYIRDWEATDDFWMLRVAEWK